MPSEATLVEQIDDALASPDILHRTQLLRGARTSLEELQRLVLARLVVRPDYRAGTTHGELTALIRSRIVQWLDVGWPATPQGMRRRTR